MKMKIDFNILFLGYDSGFIGPRFLGYDSGFDCTYIWISFVFHTKIIDSWLERWFSRRSKI